MRTLRAAALLVSLAACGGTTPTGPTADKACTDQAMADCARLGACIKNGVETRYGSTAVCITRMHDNCVLGLGATGTGNTPTSVEACATAIPGASCGDFVASNITACQPTPGTLALAAPCTYNAQCATAFCNIVKGTNCGTCSAPSMADDSCATSGCSRLMTCVSSTMKCEPTGALGSSCDSGHTCGYQLSCVTPAGAASGTCQPAGTTAGTTCDNKRVTAPGCDGDSQLSCIAATKTCTLETLAGAGQACGFVAGAEVVCTSASSCWGAMGTTPGSCLALAMEGQPCDTANGPACMLPGRCVTASATVTSGTCTLPAPASCK